MSEAADNPEVLEAVRLLMGDLVREKRYVMLAAEPGEGAASAQVLTGVELDGSGLARERSLLLRHDS